MTKLVEILQSTHSTRTSSMFEPKSQSGSLTRRLTIVPLSQVQVIYTIARLSVDSKV